jgi:hypothetical protein
MEIFNAIGLEIPKCKTLNDLAEDAERLGEPSISTRAAGTVHGRCWRIGLGLEVWTTLYESATGEVFYADCRPGFRARYTQNLSRWFLYEGEAAVAGRIENHADKIFFQLQNLTEAGAKHFERKVLTVGLCGLAYRARVAAAVATDEALECQPLSETAGNSDAGKADWRLSGRVINYNALRNPFSGSDLYWIHLDLGNFELEILINRRRLIGGKLLRVGANVKADVWLQGHIVAESTFFSNYEGVDWSASAADFWKNYKKLN